MKKILKLKKFIVICLCIILSSLFGTIVYAVTCTLTHTSSHEGYTCYMGSTPHQRVTLPITGAVECFYNGTEPSSTDMNIIMPFAKHIFDSSNESNLNVYYYLYGEHDDDIGSHEGIDLQYTADSDREVDSPVSGTVIYYGGTYGKVCICLSNNDTITFMHMTNIPSLGPTISAETVIGYQGNVGLSSGAGEHVHVQLEDGSTSSCSTGKNDQVTSLRPYDTWRTYLTHTYGTWGYYDATRHSRSCTLCGSTQYGTHYKTGAAGWGYCAVCGAYGNWPGSYK